MKNVFNKQRILFFLILLNIYGLSFLTFYERQESCYVDLKRVQENGSIGISVFFPHIKKEESKLNTAIVNTFEFIHTPMVWYYEKKCLGFFYYDDVYGM